MQKLAFAVLMFFFTLGFISGCSMHAAWGHDFYRDWKMPSGTSCCNERKVDEHGNVTGDCQPVESRITTKGLEILAEGQWVVVPEWTLRPYVSPDGRTHACILPPNTDTGSLDVRSRILCVVLPNYG